MNKYLIPSFFAFAIVLLLISCRKHSKYITCGCNSDSIAFHVTQTSFTGYPYNAGLIHYNDTVYKKEQWLISLHLQPVDMTYYGARLSICNMDNPQLKAIMNDSTTIKKYTSVILNNNAITDFYQIPILFSGNVKEICTGDTVLRGTPNFRLISTPETIYAYITLDSITVKN